MTRPKSFKLLICILFGHDFKCRGFWRDTDYGPEHDEEWTCKRCGEEPSAVFDEISFVGRLKSWWYQE
jgi:hypothetical protein